MSTLPRRALETGQPCSARVLAKAMAKQLAWAASMSYSGLVLPSGRSARDAQVTGSPCTASLLVRSRVPDLRNRLLFHTTFARLPVSGHRCLLYIRSLE